MNHCTHVVLLFVRQLTIGATGPSQRTVTSLSGHIGHVVSVRSEEQMIGIYATGIVAFVQHKHFGRDWPNVMLV